MNQRVTTSTPRVAAVSRDSELPMCLTILGRAAYEPKAMNSRGRCRSRNLLSVPPLCVYSITILHNLLTANLDQVLSLSLLLRLDEFSG